MAATLTDTGELTYLSFGIDKVESTPDGDLLCYGRATDGSLDHDDQIVDPQFSSKAIRDWLATGGNVRVQHNAQRDPAGVGLEVNTDPDGATWVKSLIVEPTAKKLLAAKALRAYSVGIARPTIVRDAVAKGGRITDGQIVEISLVDRPANARCGVQLVKSAGDGTPEYTGMVFGAEGDIQKALGGDLLTKSAMTDTWAAPDPGSLDVPAVAVPGDLSVTFTPNDMMRLMQQKFVSRHQDEVALKAVMDAEAPVYKRDIDTATRRRLAADGKALPNLSYPIENSGDLGNAATLARSGHGDVAAARRLIARRARELGVANPLDESDDVKKAEPYTGPVEPVQEALEKAAAEQPDSITVLPPAVKEAEPEVTKDPEPEDAGKPVKKAKKKPKGPKKMPPWLKGDDDGDDGDDDDKSDKAAGPEACKSLADHLWALVEGTPDVECAKCHTTPAQAAGVAGSHDMAPAPVGELMESSGPASTKGATPASASGATGESMNPVPAHREPDGAPMEAFEKDAGMSDGDDEKPTKLEAATGMKFAADLASDPELAALMRFKTLGIDEDMGRLHDLTCPAYSPEMAAKYHPYADLPSLIDSGAWQRKTLAAAAGPIEQAIKMQDLWQAVHILKSADQAALNDWRLELHKAFRDANPGPGSFPTPGCVSPQSYHRPVLTDGRAAYAGDYGSPRSAPQVATSAPNAQDFDRPPLSSAHASPSPSFMKGGGAEYPSERGVPQRVAYEQMERDKARRSLSMLHDHLNHMFPSACPMIEQDAYRQPESRPVPAGIGKADGVEVRLEKGEVIVPDAALKATPDEDGGYFADADVYKGYKKMRKKLGKKVLAGKMTVDEARAKMGRQFAQKGAQPPAEAVQKSAPPPSVPELLAPPVAPPPVAASFDPEVIKAAVAEATAPLLERLEKQQGEFTTKLAEQQRVIDAIADQPDPSTAAFSGLAFQPIQKSRRPAGVPDQAEYAARAQAMIRRNLEHTYQTHSNPVVREKAAEALASYGVDAS